MKSTRRTLTTLVGALLVCWVPVDAQQGPVHVNVDAVRREQVGEQRLVTGELRARRRSQVATREPGLVVELPVQEGTPVRKGDVVARLDTQRLEVELRQIHAEQQAVGGLVEERTATVEWRQRDLELYQKAHEGGGANAKELLDAQWVYRVTKARATEAQHQHAAIQARADLLQQRIDDMSIAAPFNGIVVATHAELGEWVGEGDPVVELVSTGRIEAWVSVPQQFFEALSKPAVELAIRIHATDETVNVGDLRIVPEVDSRGRAFAVVATLEDPKGVLAPGMSVTAWIPTGATAEYLTVSKNAVLRNDVGPFVYVARASDEAPGGPASAVAVRVLELFPVAERVAVNSAGLKPGDLVVVEGNERLFPMAPIIPIVLQPEARGGT